MFLQSKYGKQLNQDTRTTFGATGFQTIKKESNYKSHVVVGSANFGRMNFEQGEQIFPKEDIPKYKYEAKVKMTQLVDPDILGLRKKEWNNSTAVASYAQEEDFERKLTKIKLGFFDTPFPKQRDPKIEPGTDTRSNYTGWNVSTETVSRFQNQHNLDQLTHHTMDKTKGYYKKLRDYKNPTETIKNFNETIRQNKRDEKDLRDQLKTKLRFENPSATEERIIAGVNKLVYEHKMNLIRPQSEDPAQKATFCPDLTKTLRPNLGYYAYHNGTWSTNPVSPKGEVWSCCMMKQKDGEGCVRVKVNRDKWILESCASVCV